MNWFIDTGAPTSSLSLGVFAAAAKVSTLLVALAGGGMNPVSLLLKNLIYTTLLVVMLYRVRKAGTLLLFSLVSMLGERPAAGGQHHPAARHLAGRSDGRSTCRPWRRLQSGMGPGAGRGRIRHCQQGQFAGDFLVVHARKPFPAHGGGSGGHIGVPGGGGGLFTGYNAVKELRHAGIVRQ